MMDDWKLKTSPIVRLERPNERSQQYIHCVSKKPDPTNQQTVPNNNND